MTSTQETMDKKEAPTSKKPKKRARLEAAFKDLSMTLLWVLFAACLLSATYGYNIWLIYSPSVLIKDFYNVTTFPPKMNPNIKLFLMSSSIALYPLGGTFGALLIGVLEDRCGRKGTLIITNVLSILSAILMGCTHEVTTYEFKMVARLVTGICSGIIYSAVPIYIGEISPVELRGCITMTANFFFSIGVLLAQTLALREVLGNERGWPILMCFAGVMPVCQVFLLPFIPESPRYLYIQKKDEDGAREALQMLRGREDVEDEMDELREEFFAAKAEKPLNTPKLLWKRSLRWQVITVITLMASQHLTGVIAAYYYSERTYTYTHMGKDNVRFMSIATSVSFCLANMFTMFLVDSVGRKILLLSGFGVCGILCVLLAITVELQDTINEMAYFSTVFILLFLLAQCIGPNSTPCLIVLELFLQTSRASGFVIAGFVHWFMNFVSGVLFYHTEKLIGSYCFLLYFPICLATFLFILKFLPETKKRTFVDIKRIMLLRSVKKVTATVVD
uniref:solute carrier family 2, facilitated glucose transporter member 5-like n=1 Tax=Podarcis muralis TaxID=64176 RepID=UPI00109EF62B|nr:solute carrier family 2, facilitated glucose transporter member 5-like [Podarcis muralis]